MVLSAIQSPRRPTWTNRRVRHAKFFFLPGVDWCITTVNSSLTRRRVPKALLSFFCPTNPPINELTNQCMTSMQDSASAPRQIKFDTDSQKFLIDSGASAHLWNRRKDFIYYRSLSPQERKNDQVLGVSGEAVSPQGIGSIRLQIEDDLNDIHTIHLHDVRYLPEAPINIFVPQVFSQRRQAEGDSKASCSISENARTSLLHAAHQWPKAIAANLWPQAIKHVVNVRNSLPRPGKTESPLSKFAGTSVQPNLKHFHPFGCPVYVLQAPLQTRNPFPKWGELLIQTATPLTVIRRLRLPSSNPSHWHTR